MTPSLFTTQTIPTQSIQGGSIQAGGSTIQPEVLASIQQATKTWFAFLGPEQTS